MIFSHQMQPMLSISVTEESVYTSSCKELLRCTLLQISCMAQILKRCFMAWRTEFKE